MRTLIYNELATERIPNLSKVRRLLEDGNFRQADVKKVGDNLFRVRLNKSDRLLFSLYRYGEETVCLLLEHIRNHAYDRSRFLAGATIDEEQIPALDSLEEAAEEAGRLTYLPPGRERFHLLDKVLCLDDDQEAVYALQPPLVLVGSAGSGKTALTLEKMKQAIGDVLYVSLSAYLVRNAREWYYAHGYTNEDQEVTFLSFQELLETIQVPDGREATMRDFQQWFQRHRGKTRLKDPQKVYEEIRGVITGPVSDAPWLSREAYLSLGVKQSIFTEHERGEVYDLFEGYLRLLDEAGLYDPNIISHRYLDRVEPSYDFVVIDEVQDLTNIQLYLILRLLRYPGQFILGGDSNQIVHPNFFSWSGVKSLFFQERELTGPHEVIRILHTNYRNTVVVTEVANRILKLKHARFGSVDRESNFLVNSVSQEPGRLQLLADSDDVKRELNRRTAQSARIAVLVMHPEQKEAARSWFDTPLVFSVQEAKGLEYDSIVLFNFITEEAAAFREIARDVDPAALEQDELPYARARDKRDKSLEVYKFYINALYVAATRAVRNLYVLEGDHDHPVMRLLQLDQCTGELAVEAERSSTQEWQQEAQRLEMQGKAEQAQEIRERVLQQQQVPWTPLDRAGFEALREQALASDGSKKVRLEAFEYALVHSHLPTLNALQRAGFKPATQPEGKALQQLNQNRFQSYTFRKPDVALKAVDRYGVDHRDRLNLTPLMAAARLGNDEIAQALVERGADLTAVANHGLLPVQILLEQALLGEQQIPERRLVDLYERLVPGALSVQVQGRLVKLDRRLMEHFLLLMMGALFYRHLGPSVAERGETFTAATLTEYAALLPDGILPARRKRRQYISSILSKNELYREDRYNRQLFLRLRRGNYIVNPGLKLKLGDQWWAYYDLFRPSELGIPRWASQEHEAIQRHMAENLERLAEAVEAWRPAGSADTETGSATSEAER